MNTPNPRTKAAKFDLYAETPRMSRETSSTIKWLQTNFTAEWDRTNRAERLSRSGCPDMAAAGKFYLQGVRL